MAAPKTVGVHPALYTWAHHLAAHVHRIPTHDLAAAGVGLAAVVGGLNGLRTRARKHDETTRALAADAARQLKIKPEQITRRQHTWRKGNLQHTALKYEPGADDTDDTRLKLTPIIARRLANPVDIRFDHPAHTIHITRIIPPEPLPLAIPHPHTVACDPGLIPIGEDIARNPAGWNRFTSNPHMLLAGESGAGKSFAIITAVVSATRAGSPVLLCDPLSTPTLRTVRGRQGVWHVANTQPCEAALNQVDQLVNTRRQALEDGTLKESEIIPVVAVIDEFAFFRLELQKLWKKDGGKGEPPYIDTLTSAVFTYRQFGVNLLLATQRPDTKFIDGPLRDQLGTRLLLGWPRSSDFHTMMDIKEKPSIQAKGRGLLWPNREIQVWETPKADILAIPSTAPNLQDILKRGDRAVRNLPLRQTGGAAPGVTDGQVAGVTRGSAARPKGVVQPPISDAQQRRIAELHHADWSTSAIAKDVGVSRPTVDKYRARLRARQEVDAG